MQLTSFNYKKFLKCKLIIYMNITIYIRSMTLNTRNKETALNQLHLGPWDYVRRLKINRLLFPYPYNSGLKYYITGRNL